jgi:hypothetical protein
MIGKKKIEGTREVIAAISEALNECNECCPVYFSIVIWRECADEPQYTGGNAELAVSEKMLTIALERMKQAKLATQPVEGHA